MQKRLSRLIGGLLLAMSLALTLVVVPAQPASAANNNQTGYQFFVNKGLTGYQSAGVIGNLIQESGDPINPRADQPGGPGKGIAQWSEGDRWDNLIAYANRRGQSRYSLDLQLNFIWYELTTNSYNGLSDLRAARNVSDATRAFQDKFERCGRCNFASRLRYANNVYAAYGGGTTPSTTETNLPTLRSGSRGSAVRTMQYVLRSRGYSVSADGVFGPKTKSAVQRFQGSKRLTRDGIVGSKTWKALLPTLRKASTGNAVKGLQRELRAEGYNIAVDGQFGSRTRSAVISYQKKKKLSVDGVVGRDTWGSLID